MKKTMTYPCSTPDPSRALSHSSAVPLIRKNGQMVQFTSQRMQEWCSRHLDRVTSIQLFGFRSPDDMIVFLNSPAGSSVKKMIGEELAEIAAIEDYQQFVLREEALKNENRLLHILLGLAHKRHLWQKLLDDDLVDSEKQIKKNKELYEKYVDAMDNTGLGHDEIYKDVLHHLMDELRDYDHEASQIHQDIADLNQEKAVMDNWYQDFDHMVSHFEGFVAPFEENQESKEALVTNIDHKIKTHEALIKNKTQTLANRMDAFQDQKRSIQDLHSLNLQLEGLKIIREVVHGNKKLYNGEGKEVHKLKDAVFVVNHTKQLIKDNGVLYLVNANKTLPLNHHDKSEGRLELQKAQHAFTNLKTLVQDHRQNHEKRFQTQAQSLNTKLDALNYKRLVLSKQLVVTQATMNQKRVGITIQNDLRRLEHNPSVLNSRKCLEMKNKVKKAFGETKETRPFLEQLDRINRTFKVTSGQITNLQKSFNKIFTNQEAISEDRSQISNDRTKYVAP